ncbi:OsmC family protein [Halobellus rubicundus]|uniref:OsmC family protein n=1 Tax=Halobellus rubicundus TaxID=2996466 RepID=A0ABD5MFW3_9EURY
MTSPLEDLGYPLAFPIEESVAGLDAPEPALGQAHRARVRSLGGMQKEALVTDARTGTTWRLASDEGEYLEGDDVAPAPLAHMTTGMVSSFASEILALADERGIDVRDLEVTQDSYYTMTGSALAGTMTGGALPVDLDVTIDADADEGTLRDLVGDAVRTAPVYGLIDGVHDSTFTLVANGEEVEPDRVTRLDGPVEADPEGLFESIPRDADERQPPIVHRTGRETEPLPDGDEKYTSGAGSSLSEDQDRILHLRGTCTLRADGTKHVAVELFSPIGTVFEFVSDDPPGRGGEGRAPDPMTYVAAGIGFCFMTQMGRYADIVDADLDAYRIVQDTHVARGDAGGSGERTPARSAPVETHVFVDTGEDESFARELLDMSEQTCFLHALCRTDLDGPNANLSD